MLQLFADLIVDSIRQAHELYYQLVLIVGPAGSGKTRSLREVSARIGAPVINVNLELSRRMLDLTERQRCLRLPQLLSEILQASAGDVVLLDNIEILFDVTLKQDPLRLLQGLSRNRTVVAAWNGSIEQDRLTYAIPGHPEYRQYPVRDFLTVGLEMTGVEHTGDEPRGRRVK